MMCREACVMEANNLAITSTPPCENFPQFFGDNITRIYSTSCSLGEELEFISVYSLFPA